MLLAELADHSAGCSELMDVRLKCLSLKASLAVSVCAGVVSQSAQALSKLLISFATSRFYSQLQLLRVQLLKSHDSSPMPLSAQSAEASAEAVAADWACLVWLLQTAPQEVAAGLKAEWQRQQLQEFGTWVRPAAELSIARSKTAAKVGSAC